MFIGSQIFHAYFLVTVVLVATQQISLLPYAIKKYRGVIVMRKLKLYFDPELNDKQRQLCQRFWQHCELEKYSDLTNQVLLLQRAFELKSSHEVFNILSKCYVFDRAQQCEICQSLRRIHYPFELQQAADKNAWRCHNCRQLVT